MSSERRKISEQLREKARAGCPAVYVLSSEDFRTREDIRTAARETRRKLFVWSVGKGLFEMTPQGDLVSKDPLPNTPSPPGVLKAMLELPEKSITVLRLFHHFVTNPEVQVMLLDIIEEYRKNKRMLIITSPIRTLPPELEKEFAFVENALPDASELSGVVDGIVLGAELKPEDAPSPEVRKKLLEAASGLTAVEAENAICLSYVRGRAQGTPWDPAIVQEEKCLTIRKGGLMDFIPTGKEGMKQVGGLQLYKHWLARRARAYSEKAVAFGLPTPRGVLMVGPPGAGKSLGAKATSEEMGLPLLRCDIAALFGMYVGQSEANIRKALEVAEIAAPCVLWLEEIDKAFAGNRGSLDSGVGARVFGTLLTWMQEKKAPVFVYATCNDVQSLPSELLRKGRFDELFSVMLPTQEERKEIFKIHITKRGRGAMVDGDNPKLNLGMLASSTKGFSGSEIEEAVIEALHISFEGDRDLNMVDLGEAVSETRPLSQTMKEHFKELEKWCKDRTRPANAPEKDVESMIPVKEGSRTMDA
jgi:hypothetical protein